MKLTRYAVSCTLLLLARWGDSYIFTRLGMDKSVQVSSTCIIVLQYSTDPKLFCPSAYPDLYQNVTDLE